VCCVRYGLFATVEQPQLCSATINVVKKQGLAVLLLLGMTCFAVAQTQTSKTKYTVYEHARSDVKPPRPISTPVPAPPDDVDKELKVKASFVVTPDGSVTDIKLLKRSTPEFDDYEVATLRQWKFEPATKDSTPVALRLETEMRSHK
jgi:TonB family protein